MLTHCSPNSFSMSTMVPIPRGVPRIWEGGGQEFFFSDLGICMSQSDMLRMAKPCTLLGGFGGMLPREIFLKRCKFMVFHSMQRKVKYPVLTINNTIIERVKQFNFLGIILHYTLKWQKHIDYISKKVSKAIGVMYRLKHIYPEAVLLIIYQSIINAHFTYGLLVWGSKINTNHPLHLLQKRALRIVKNTDYVAHSEPICKDLRLLKMPDMFRFALWKFYFKLMNNQLPPYFENMKPVLPRICDNYDIRRPSFHLPLIKHDFAEQLISYQLTTMLNENGSTRFSSKVFTHSFSGFSYYLKNVIIDRYIMNCNVINCVSCERVANHQAHVNCN